jgi:hypothetical protein
VQRVVGFRTRQWIDIEVLGTEAHGHRQRRQVCWIIQARGSALIAKLLLVRFESAFLAGELAQIGHLRSVPSRPDACAIAGAITLSFQVTRDQRERRCRFGAFRARTSVSASTFEPFAITTSRVWISV